MVTIREGDTIYFGIARCRLNYDRFDKGKGLDRARVRANVAKSNPAGEWKVDGGFYLHRSGLFGNVKIGEVPKLLEYFRNVDELNIPQHK